MRPLGVILAGGAARRMGGGDKALLRVDDACLLEHVVRRLAAQVGAVALSANGPAERFAAFGLPVLPDASEERPGPLAGVLAGLDWAAVQGAETIVTAAADTPFLPADLVARLVAAADGAAAPLALAATEAGLVRHPTFGLWPVALREDLRAALASGTRRIVAWTEPRGAATAVFPDAGDFFNVNTPEDLEIARAMARERA